MLATIALLALVVVVVVVLRPYPALTTPTPVPLSPQPRHVSFSIQSDSPRDPQPPEDHLARVFHSSPKPARRLLRLSFPAKRRCSSDSYVVHLDRLDLRTPSPPPRSRFVNPFAKLSPPSNHLVVCPNSCVGSAGLSSSGMSPSSLPARRRTLVNKFKSIFRSTPDPSPIIRSKPIFTTLSSKLRRKPVARTQPYGPPWNAPMPVPDFDVSPHSLQKPARTMSSPVHSSRKCSVNRCSLSETTSPSQLSPRTFINELDEKLSLLQQQRIQNRIPSLHR